MMFNDVCQMENVSTTLAMHVGMRRPKVSTHYKTKIKTHCLELPSFIVHLTRLDIQKNYSAGRTPRTQLAQLLAIVKSSKYISQVII